MITREKRKAVIGIPLGLAMFVTPLVMLRINHNLVGWPGFWSMIGGLILYLWGCLALAKGKGYSSAMLLTVVLGVLFPAVVLLVLPDKHKKRGMRRRAPSANPVHADRV